MAQAIKTRVVGNGGTAILTFNFKDSISRGTVSYLNTARSDLAATTVGDYALFGGGYIGTSPYLMSTVDAYNTSLTK